MSPLISAASASFDGLWLFIHFCCVWSRKEFLLPFERWYSFPSVLMGAQAKQITEPFVFLKTKSQYLMFDSDCFEFDLHKKESGKLSREEGRERKKKKFGENTANTSEKNSLRVKGY